MLINPEIQSLFDAVRTAPAERCPQLTARLMALTYSWEKRHIGTQCDCCEGGNHIDEVWVDPTTGRWVTNAIGGFDFLTDTDRALLLARRIIAAWEPNLRRQGAPDGNIWWLSICPMGPFSLYHAERETPAAAIVEAALVAAGARPPGARAFTAIDGAA